MSRHIIARPNEPRTPFDLDAFVSHAHTRNQRHCEACTTPFPKAPSRWRSPYHFTPRPLTCTTAGDIEGGLSWLVGATLDCSFTRAIWAPNYGASGGHCDDPASRVVLAVAAKVDQYTDSARFCDALHQADKGRRSRALAGLHAAIPGEDDLSHFRHRVGAQAIEVPMAVVVEVFRPFGRINGALWATDGQLEPSYARDKGGTDACQGCQSLRLDAASRLELGRQLHSGAKRLQLPCPFPEVVAKVRQTTTKKGKPQDPKVVLLESEDGSPAHASRQDRQQVATLLGLPADEGPALRLPWGHLRRGPQGELRGSCPQVPADLEAKVGDHIDTKAPTKTARVFGYLHQKTLDINPERGLELPLGHTTSPANANEGTHVVEHRAALAIPVLPGQGPLGAAASDVTANSLWMRDQGGGRLLTTTHATKTSQRKPAANGAMIHPAHPMRLAAASVAPMATTTTPTRDNTAVAGSVRPRNSGTAPTTPVSGAPATA
jgi:hypothetical protein